MHIVVVASVLSAPTDLFNFALRCACTGELPLEIIRMKAKGIILEYGLYNNKGFTLPSNIGLLGDDITELDLCNCSLTGRLSTRTERLRTF